MESWLSRDAGFNENFQKRNVMAPRFRVFEAQDRMAICLFEIISYDSIIDENIRNLIDY